MTSHNDLLKSKLRQINSLTNLNIGIKEEDNTITISSDGKTIIKVQHQNLEAAAEVIIMDLLILGINNTKNKRNHVPATGK